MEKGKHASSRSKNKCEIDRTTLTALSVLKRKRGGLVYSETEYQDLINDMTACYYVFPGTAGNVKMGSDLIGYHERLIKSVDMEYFNDSYRIIDGEFYMNINHYEEFGIVVLDSSIHEYLQYLFVHNDEGYLVNYFYALEEDPRNDDDEGSVLMSYGNYYMQMYKFYKDMPKSEVRKLQRSFYKSLSKEDNEFYRILDYGLRKTFLLKLVAVFEPFCTPTVSSKYVQELIDEMLPDYAESEDVEYRKSMKRKDTIMLMNTFNVLYKNERPQNYIRPDKINKNLEAEVFARFVYRLGQRKRRIP